MPLLDSCKSVVKLNSTWWQGWLVLLSIVSGTWLMGRIIPADISHLRLQPPTETSRYEVRVHIGELNFGSFKQIILASDDLLAHLPYSFNALSPPQKTSGWPDLLLSLNHQRKHWSQHQYRTLDHPHIAAIPRHKHLYLQRHTISHQGMYAQLKPISEDHQTPQQIDLVLIKTKLYTNNESDAGEGDNMGDMGDDNNAKNFTSSSTQVAKISLFSSIPYTWSVESTDAAIGHFNEYAHISYQSLSQSSASQPWLTSP